MRPKGFPLAFSAACVSAALPVLTVLLALLRAATNPQGSAIRPGEHQAVAQVLVGVTVASWAFGLTALLAASLKATARWRRATITLALYGMMFSLTCGCCAPYIADPPHLGMRKGAGHVWHVVVLATLRRSV